MLTIQISNVASFAGDSSANVFEKQFFSSFLLQRMGISRTAALTVMLLPIGVLSSAISASHYGDCSGTGKMPPPDKRSGKFSIIHNATTQWRYVFAEGRVSCANGEKVRGRVQLRNDNVQAGDKDGIASYGACGPL